VSEHDEHLHRFNYRTSLSEFVYWRHRGANTMKGRQGREIRTLNDCQRFLDRHSEIAAEINASGSRAELDDAVREAAAFAVQQQSSVGQRRAQSGAAKAARRKLRQAMRQVAEVAKSRYRDATEFEALFMPPSGIGFVRLIAAAHAMANVSEPLAPVFVASGLRPTFANDIHARANALAAASNLGQSAVVERAGATQGIGVAIKRGRRAIAVIDSLLVPTLDESSDLLTEWKRAKRIAAKPGPSPT
jgi:hypothetical protein